MNYKNLQEGVKRAKRIVRANPNWKSGLQILVRTRKPCSCMMCGHRRKWFGKTMQEKKADLDFSQQLETVK